MRQMRPPWLPLAVAGLGLTLSMGAWASVATADPPPPVAGALTSGDSLLPNQGNGGYDVRHYDIDLVYSPVTVAQPSGSIQATTTITAWADQPLSSFSFDFKGLEVESVTVDQVPAGHSRIEDPGQDLHKLVVTPAQPVSGQFTVAVSYFGQPEEYVLQVGFTMAEGWMANRDYTAWVNGQSVTYPADGGATGIGQPNGNMTWFPANLTPADKATFTTSLTVPDQYSAVGLGQLREKTPAQPGTTRWVWEESVATSAFLAVASIGQFTEHDGQVTVNGQTIPISAYGDPNLEALSPGGAEGVLELLEEILDWGTDQFGAYPASVAGYILAPVRAGWALEIFGKPFFARPIQDIVLVHEYVHMWAGDSVSVQDWRDLWLAEGFATYAEWLWQESQGGVSALAQAESIWTANLDESPLWVASVARPAVEQLWGIGSYTGGGLAFAALRAGLGDDVFGQLVRQWFATYAGANASTEDFIDLAQAVSGRDLSQWAQDWLYEPGRPAAWPDLTTYPPLPVVPAEPDPDPDPGSGSGSLPGGGAGVGSSGSNLPDTGAKLGLAGLALSASLVLAGLALMESGRRLRLVPVPSRAAPIRPRGPRHGL
ncbi:MAG: M1 family metallopeptidase [Propionibacteriaceae bacterium]|jgi:aminopeptidase N|nr:M1 family metallopeptidase [Propionibacteriaceae bacterium]